MTSLTKTLAVDLPDGSHLEITAQERVDHPRLSDGFSITGSLWERRGSMSGRTRKQLGRDSDTTGCLHEEILRALPQLAPVVAVHLADCSGRPIHAKANGWYVYSGAAASYEYAMIISGRDYGYSHLLERSNHDRAAEILHIAPNQLPTDLQTREQFDAFVDSLAPVYLEQARQARDVIAGLDDHHYLHAAA